MNCLISKRTWKRMMSPTKTHREILFIAKRRYLTVLKDNVGPVIHKVSIQVLSQHPVEVPVPSATRVMTREPMAVLRLMMMQVMSALASDHQ